MNPYGPLPAGADRTRDCDNDGDQKMGHQEILVTARRRAGYRNLDSRVTIGGVFAPTNSRERKPSLAPAAHFNRFDVRG